MVYQRTCKVTAEQMWQPPCCHSAGARGPAWEAPLRAGNAYCWHRLRSATKRLEITWSVGGASIEVQHATGNHPPTLAYLPGVQLGLLAPTATCSLGYGYPFPTPWHGSCLGHAERLHVVSRSTPPPPPPPWHPKRWLQLGCAVSYQSTPPA